MCADVLSRNPDPTNTESCMDNDTHDILTIDIVNDMSIPELLEGMACVNSDKIVTKHVQFGSICKEIDDDELPADMLPIIDKHIADSIQDNYMYQPESNTKAHSASCNTPMHNADITSADDSGYTQHCTNPVPSSSPVTMTSQPTADDFPPTAEITADSLMVENADTNDCQPTAEQMTENAGKLP